VQSAEEVVQETFLSALSHLDQYAGRGAERAWLLGILKRKIVDLIRKRCRTSSSSETDAADDLSERLFDDKGNWRAEAHQFGPQPSAEMERREFWRIFRDCLAGLPQRQADVFMLREIEGYSTQGICKEFTISPSNLWVLLYRARLRLSLCMKSRWGPEKAS